MSDQNQDSVVVSVVFLDNTDIKQLTETGAHLVQYRLNDGKPTLLRLVTNEEMAELKNADAACNAANEAMQLLARRIGENGLMRG